MTELFFIMQQSTTEDVFSREFDEVKCYYRVCEFIKSHQVGVPTYENSVEFAFNDLEKARQQAVKYYLDQRHHMKEQGCSVNERFAQYKTQNGLPQDEQYFLAIALIECYNDDEIEHYIAGEVDVNIQDARALKSRIFKD